MHMRLGNCCRSDALVGVGARLGGVRGAPAAHQLHRHRRVLQQLCAGRKEFLCCGSYSPKHLPSTLARLCCNNTVMKVTLTNPPAGLRLDYELLALILSHLFWPHLKIKWYHRKQTWKGRKAIKGSPWGGSSRFMSGLVSAPNTMIDSSTAICMRSSSSIVKNMLQCLCSHPKLCDAPDKGHARQVQQMQQPQTKK